MEFLRSRRLYGIILVVLALVSSSLLGVPLLGPGHSPLFP